MLWVGLYVVCDCGSQPKHLAWHFGFFFAFVFNYTGIGMHIVSRLSVDLALRTNIVGPDQTTSALSLHCFIEDCPQYLLSSPGEK